MNARTFTRRVAKAVDDAEAQYQPLTRAYERLIRDAGADAAKQLTAMTAAVDWMPPPEGTVLDPHALAVAAVARLRAVHERILETVAGAALSRTEVRWDIAHPLSRELLAKAGARTGERLGEAVQPVLREVITAAYAEGLSVKDTAERIRAAIQEAAPWQAEMLARTDLVSLSNGGSLMAAEMVGMPYKQWQATYDSKTRDDHADADGQVVPVDQPFDVGGELLDYPGDPAGSDANTANCRCTVLYADELTGAPAILAEGGPMTELGEAFNEGVNVAMTAAARKPVKWEAVLAVEGEPTEDGRLLAPGSVTWRETPLPLMVLVETGPGGHEGAQLGGKIERIWRANADENDKVGRKIMGSGVFDSSEVGVEAARLVKEEMIRGISIDLAVRQFEVRVLDDDGRVIDDDDVDPLEVMSGDVDALFVVTDGVIGAATACPFQAIANATIAIAASADNSEWTVTRQTDYTLAEVPPGQVEEALANLSRVADLSAQVQELSALVASETQRADYAEAAQAELEQEVATLRGKLEAAVRDRQTAEESARAQIAAVTAQFVERPGTVRVERDEDGRIAAVVRE